MKRIALAVVVVLACLIVVWYKLPSTQHARMMDAIEADFHRQEPKVDLNRFRRYYLVLSSKEIAGYYVYEDDNRSHSVEPGRVWVDKAEDFPGGADEPCYGYYILSYNPNTKILHEQCGEDGTIPDGHPPPGAG